MHGKQKLPHLKLIEIKNMLKVNQEVNMEVEEEEIRLIILNIYEKI